MALAWWAYTTGDWGAKEWPLTLSANIIYAFFDVVYGLKALWALRTKRGRKLWRMSRRYGSDDE